MNNPFDIAATVARVMFQPADYLHSSRLFTGLAPEKQSVQYRRMQNAECRMQNAECRMQNAE
ncbi:MAG: hypothetical protein RR510_13330, partial [Morganella sp. (in: enterobacteria)]